MPKLADIPLTNLYALVQTATEPTSSPNATFTNWGRTFTCSPITVFRPDSEFQCEVILEIARREGKRLRAAGIGHSPSDLACTDEFMVVMTGMKSVLEVNTDKNYVVAQGGIILSDLHEVLSAHGLAMSNLGSISDQTLAGIMTTPTHGSGIEYGVICTHVMALTLLLADGSRVRCSSHERPELFTATLCGLGATGLILSIQLQVEPAFNLKDVQDTRSFDDVVDNLDTIVHSAQHVRMWWFEPSHTVRVSRVDRTSEARSPAGAWFWHSFCGYHIVQFLLFLGRYFLWVNPRTSTFASWVISQPSAGVDESHRIFNVDCRYPQHTTEWAIPYVNTQACLRELRAWLEQEASDPHGLRPHFPVEIRFSAPDSIWLSPSQGPTCWLGIVQYKPYKLDVPHKDLFERFESIVARHDGRPHWAKAHRLRPNDLRKLYPRLDDFIRVVNEVDPQGVFRNQYIDRHFFSSEGPTGVSPNHDFFRARKPF